MVLPYKELIKLAALQFGEKKRAGESENILGVHTKSEGTARDSLASEM